MISGKKLPDKVKVVIIGGGVAGASVAYHLAERGFTDVILLEKDTIASGSSSKAGGYLSYFVINEQALVLQNYGMSLYKKFDQEGNIELHPCPYLLPLREKDPGLFKALSESIVKIGKRIGSEGAAEFVDPEKCKKLIPGIKVKDIAHLACMHMQ